MQRTLAAEWAEFRAQGIPRHAPDAQLNAMREAFMAGAAGALQCLAGDGVENLALTELAARIHLTHAEIEAYCKSQVPQTIRER